MNFTPRRISTTIVRLLSDEWEYSRLGDINSNASLMLLADSAYMEEEDKTEARETR